MENLFYIAGIFFFIYTCAMLADFSKQLHNISQSIQRKSRTHEE